MSKLDDSIDRLTDKVSDSINNGKNASNNVAETTKNVSNILGAIKTILIILAVAAVCAGGYFFFRTSSIGFEKTKIDNTANQITEIKKIGQWDFLTLECEVLVDTLRERQFPFPDDQLARIYKGALHFGIDLDQADQNWIEVQGDSIISVHLPAIRLLDDNFIDEANTITFYENGKWDNTTKEAMYESAKAKMLKLASEPQYYEMARTQAENRFRSLFKVIGFKEVNIHYQE